MADYTYTPVKVAFHKVPINTDCGTEWIEGEAQKGNYEAERYLSIVIFSASDIATNVGTGLITSGAMNLTRNAEYGKEKKRVTIVPVKLDSIPEGKMTDEECRALGVQTVGKTWVTMSSEAVAVPLAGAVLKKIQDGTANAFLLEAEENDADFARYSAVTLTITVGTALQMPVWTREIGQGDIISDKTHSHKEDIVEMLHYLNIKRAADSLENVAVGTLENGKYSDWAGIMLLMRTAFNACMTAENKSEVVFSTLAAGDYPSALIINEIRNALSLTDGALEISACAASGKTVAKSESGSTLITWNSGSPKGGQFWQYENYWYNSVMERWEKQKVYYKCFGFWVLENAANIASLLTGKTISSAFLQVTKTGGADGSSTIKLYGITLDAAPTENKSINSIFTSTLCADSSIATGETKQIELNADAITALKSGTIKGFGITDASGHIVMSTSAKLIVNYA